MTRHFLSPEAQARFSQARIDVITGIGRLARETEFVSVDGLQHQDPDTDEREQEPV